MICSSVCPSFGTLALLIGRSRSSTAYDNSTSALYRFLGFGSAPAQLPSRRHRSTNCKTVGRIIASNISMPDTGSRNAIKSQTLRPMLSDSASDPPCNPPASLEPWTPLTAGRSSRTRRTCPTINKARNSHGARMCAVSDFPQLGSA